MKKIPKIMKKVLDKWNNSCYNKGTKREGNTSRKGDKTNG
jgi:hypothetical protein